MDLLAALARLPVEQREPLLLVTLEQFSYAECAEVLRIPVGTVMSRVSRGRAALRACSTAMPPHPGTRSLRRVV
jgi:RNA polymerase sigma-70 factor (ECF subfamily)